MNVKISIYRSDIFAQIYSVSSSEEALFFYLFSVRPNDTFRSVRVHFGCIEEPVVNARIKRTFTAELTIALMQSAVWMNCLPSIYEDDFDDEDEAYDAAEDYWNNR